MYKILFILMIGVLSGCATKPGFVGREWAGNMRELGINPLFPPRAGLRVGDVFIVEGNTSEESSQSDIGSLGIFFDHLPIGEEVKKFYRTRNEITANTLVEPSVLNLNTRQNDSMIRLEAVAFPGFVKATASGADIAGLIPNQAMPVGFSTKLRSVKSAVLTVGAAESYSVPMKHIIDYFGSEREYLEKIQSKLQPDALKTPRYIDVIFINEIYFARSFNVTIHEEDSAVVGAALPSATPFDAKDGTLPTAASAKVSAESVATNTAGDVSSNIKNQLNDDLNTSTKPIPTSAGGTLSVGRTATGDISLTQDYKDPIAIGYRGIRRRLQSTTINGQSTISVTPSTTLTPLMGVMPKQ